MVGCTGCSVRPHVHALNDALAERHRRAGGTGTCSGANDSLLRGDVIIGDVVGTLILINSRPALLWQLLHSAVNFSKAASNLSPSLALIASRKSSADCDIALVSATGTFGKRTLQSSKVALICDNSYSASGQFLRYLPTTP